MEIKTINPIKIRDLLIYNDGLLLWKRRDISSFKSSRCGKTWNSRFAGKVAGTICKEGNVYYYKITIDRKQFYAHRIVWSLFYDNVPFSIDHIDGNGLNNKIENLRDGYNVNAINIKVTYNKSGCVGVSYSKSRNKWVAQYSVNNRTHSLGRYDAFEKAVDIRRKWEIENNYNEIRRKP